MSGDLTVTGGRGGTTARLEDLGGVATALLSAADRLTSAGAVIRSETAWLSAHSHLDHVACAQALVSLRPLEGGPASLAETGERCRGLAADLRAAATLYQHAEGTADRVSREVLGAQGRALGFGGVVPASPFLGLGVVGTEVVALTVTEAATSKDGLSATSLIAALRRSGEQRLVAGVSGIVDGMVPRMPWDHPRGESSVERVSADLVELVPQQPMVVLPVPLATVGQRPVRGAADAARAISTAYDAAPGSVLVQRVDHADGSRGWVVAIPGTQSSSMTGSNPMDMSTNLRLMAGKADDSSALVARALAGAGARPQDAVMLAGHSQGGMAAVRLAADPEFSSTYDVKAVLTFGSPVGEMEVPSGTQALHVEHVEEPVAALDGTPNPDEPNRVTASRSLAGSEDARDRQAATEPFGPHDLTVYGRTAERVDSADDPSVHAWREAADAVWGEPGDTVTTEVFQGVRKP